MEIRYPNGRVRIELDVFFPAAQTKMKKLKSLIRISDDAEQYMGEIHTWFSNTRAEMMAYRRRCSEQSLAQENGMQKSLCGSEQYRRHEATMKFFQKEEQIVIHRLESLEKNRLYMEKE